MAQQAGMSTQAFEDFYFRVCTFDYRRYGPGMKALADLMNKTDRVHLKGPGTDLKFSIKDIGAVPCGGLRNIPEEALQPFLLIEAPRLLFPFARQIIAEASQNTGFPPLLLDPIDFAGAYMQQIQGQQGAGEPASPGANGGSAPGGSAEPAETADETPQG
jgi:hypothetical protein